MRLLLLLTSHNSLSQRLTTILDELSSDVIKGPKHEPSNQVQNLTYTIEYALNEAVMLKAVERVKPDVIVGAFLTKKVPRAIWSKYMILILHPGPPGDAGPSAIDWALMGDSGAYEDAAEALEKECLDPEAFHSGVSTRRKEWGVTCLQAEEEFDLGPIWAFETFDIPPEVTKSALYRGPVTQAACECIITALARIQQAKLTASNSGGEYSPALLPPADSAVVTITGQANEIINTRHRPLLKPNQRAANPRIHTARQMAAIIRAGDSQPGVQVTWLDFENAKKSLFLYGAWVENGELSLSGGPGPASTHDWENYEVGKIVATRHGAILVKCRRDPEAAEERGVWITHARSPMSKETKVLPAKLPAVDAMTRAGLGKHLEGVLEWPLETWDKVDTVDGRKTWQQVWVEKVPLSSPEGGMILYVHFDFYNGACSTQQCELLLKAIIESVESDHTIRILCLMGSRNYFSNGIALNVIEASPDPAKESWKNINAIDDVVEYLLGDSSPRAESHPTAFMKGRKTLTERGIITISAIQSNAAAGGLALATCCDIVLCSANAVLNPHYRSVGLFGSEFHRYHWPARVGVEASEGMMKRMLPIGPEQAREMGLVDEVIGSRSSSPDDIELGIKDYILRLARARLGQKSKFPTAPWLKSNSGDSPISSLLADLVRAKKAHHASLPFPLVFYRNEELSQMLLDFYHPVRSKRYHDRRRAFVGKYLPKSTPLRFAEHNRGEEGVERDEEEMERFDDAPGWKNGEEWAWVGEKVPEGFLEFKPFEAGLLSKKQDTTRTDTFRQIPTSDAPTTVPPTRSSEHTQSSLDSDRSKPSTDSTSTRQTLSPSLPTEAPMTSSADKTQQGRGKRASLDLRSTFRRALSLATWNKGSTGSEAVIKEGEIGTVEAGRKDDLARGSGEDEKEPEMEDQARLIRAHQDAGVIFTDPGRVYIQPSVLISPGVQIGIDVQLWGTTSLAPLVKIEGPTILIDAAIAEGAHIRPFSHLQACTVGKGAIVGPYARLREETHIGQGCFVGNFVEIKGSELGEGAKANHLAFIGQAKVGKGTNLGAGTITCNYDGYGKYGTELGDGVFVGSNSTLVAPLKVGDGVVVGAGSVVTQDVEEGGLVFGRARQVVKEGRAPVLREKLAARHREAIKSEDKHEDKAARIEDKEEGKEAQAILYPCYYSVPDEAHKEQK